MFIFSTHTLETYRSEATSHRWRASFWPNEFVGGTSSEQPHQLNAIWGILEFGFEWDYHELGPISTHAFSSRIYESLVLWKRSTTRFKRPGPGWSMERTNGFDCHVSWKMCPRTKARRVVFLIFFCFSLVDGLVSFVRYHKAIGPEFTSIRNPKLWNMTGHQAPPQFTVLDHHDVWGFHQMFPDVITPGNQLMNVDPRCDWDWTTKVSCCCHGLIMIYHGLFWG